jgi:hypothetical protein
LRLEPGYGVDEVGDLRREVRAAHVTNNDHKPQIPVVPVEFLPAIGMSQCTGRHPCGNLARSPIQPRREAAKP